MKILAVAILALVISAQSNHANAQAPIDLGFGDLRIGMDYEEAISRLFGTCPNGLPIRGGGYQFKNCMEVNGVKRLVEIYGELGPGEKITIATIIVALGGYSEKKIAALDSWIAAKYERLAVLGNRNRVLKEPTDRRTENIVYANGQVGLSIDPNRNRIFLTYASPTIAKAYLSDLGLN